MGTNRIHQTVSTWAWMSLKVELHLQSQRSHRGKHGMMKTSIATLFQADLNQSVRVLPLLRAWAQQRTDNLSSLCWQLMLKMMRRVMTTVDPETGVNFWSQRISRKKLWKIRCEDLFRFCHGHGIKVLLFAFQCVGVMLLLTLFCNHILYWLRHHLPNFFQHFPFTYCLGFALFSHCSDHVLIKMVMSFWDDGQSVSVKSLVIGDVSKYKVQLDSEYIMHLE